MHTADARLTGCGDGFFTKRIRLKGKPTSIVGIDYSQEAIKIAKAKNKVVSIKYLIGNAHHLPFKKNSFDIALLQSVLHHDDNPGGMIEEAFRVAPEIIIHEPNGNNFGLKMIEKISKYHLEHHEKSYSTSVLAHLIKETGGEVKKIEYAGFVPMFCPDTLARIMKFVEPIIEKIPLIRKYLCSVTLIFASRIFFPLAFLVKSSTVP